jgi:general stress protein 26
MGLSTSTLEMQIPEQHRERLHLLVQATRTMLVLSGGGDERFAGQPMVLLRADDDTTMYVAASLDRGQVAALGRDPRVTVVMQGSGYAVFDAEAQVLRERALLERLTRDEAAVLGRDKADPMLAVLVISPIEGAYWEGARRHAYQYRFPLGRREAQDTIELRGRLGAASGAGPA